MSSKINGLCWQDKWGCRDGGCNKKGGYCEQINRFCIRRGVHVPCGHICSCSGLKGNRFAEYLSKT
ncbi:hypothetical protein BpHYR1_053320 [Brachionus plicatilis]|uniref:Uncharacterized protein n=1 Tax=Brachionus plicatilis TaxID=10195 RepID=A0A3M7QBR6_BRAPC|nr:hypothetical protein BpHYR1_053320 [Brachionus plicatilis]